MRLKVASLLRDMNLRKGVTLLLTAMLGLILLGMGTRHVVAQQARDYECRVTERTGQVVALDCMPGYATGHDRVLIYGELPTDWSDSSAAVASLPDIANGALVFDANADDTANVIVVFSQRTDGALIADIYDDQDGDGVVSSRTGSATHLEVTETGPVVQVIAPDGWWQRDGVVNFNLDITVDGLVRASFGSVFRQFLHTDGTPEVYVHIRDTDKDGRPDYEWRQLYLPMSESSGYPRTEIVVNTEDDEAPITGAVMWPYLGDTYSDLSQYAKLTYFSSSPPIDVDWSSSRVTHVAEFVGSRTEPGNYFIYSIARLKEDEVSAANFENPFAYYDLSGQNLDLPTLMIRDAYFGPRDPFFLGGRGYYPTNDIVYVWRYPSGEAEQAPVWDYKISLVGAYEYTSIVEVGDLSIVTVEYAELPYWVTERTWNFATFVANEGIQAPNSEGISAWGAILEHLAPESYQYMAGLTDQLPFDSFTNISEGYRGEIAPDLNARARVYISNLDRKLHMVGSTSGVWRLDSRTEMLYANLDGDAYLDQWQYLEGGEVRRQLNFVEGYLVYGGDREVLLKRVDIAPSVFESLPPRNHEEWVALGQQLEANRRDFAPGDFEAMVMQFEGPTSHIEGATLRDFRPTESGFRFVLTLEPEFRVAAGDDWLGLQGLPAREYAVTCSNGTFRVEPLTPARPEIVPGSLRLSNPAPAELEPVQIEATLRNAGLEDLADLPVRAYVAGPDSPLQPIGVTTVTLLAGGSALVRFGWTPPAPGEWQIALAWGEDEGHSFPSPLSANGSLNVQVAAQPPLDVATALRLSNVGQPLLLLAFLTSLSLVAAGLALTTIHRARSRR